MRVERCTDQLCPMHLPGTRHEHVIMVRPASIPLWPSVLAVLVAVGLIAGLWWWLW